MKKSANMSSIIQQLLDCVLIPKIRLSVERHVKYDASAEPGITVRYAENDALKIPCSDSVNVQGKEVPFQENSN